MSGVVIARLRRCAVLAAIVALTQAPLALAHGDSRPQHGGRVQVSGETVFELVVADGNVDIWLREEGMALPASGYSARLTVTEAGKRDDLPLQDVGGNHFRAACTPPAHARIMVTLTAKADGSRTFGTFPAQ